MIKLKKIYAWLSKLILSSKTQTSSEIILLVASGYLLIKKSFGFSISGWLLNNALHQPVVNTYVFLSASILILALLIKMISLIFRAFPIASHIAVDPEEISECLQVMNKEICDHINKYNDDKSGLKRQHSFDVNTRLIIDSLAEHITKSLSSIEVKGKDVFISLYSFDENTHSLKYELHYDPKKDWVQTRTINLSSSAFEEYECVKCMNSTANTCYVLEKSSYNTGNAQRLKTMKQYMGCKLISNGFTFGFLNIEFHTHDIFISEEQMQDFMEESIFPFRLLLEYQYLKRKFFRLF